MKLNRFFYFLIFSLLLNALYSCEKDDTEKRDTNFDVPVLTDDNTIQFTVTTKANDYAYVLLDGGKIAVDWGDGEITKDNNPGRGELWRMEFTHIYKQAGEYKVKIWADEVTFINLSALLKDNPGETRKLP